VALVAVSVRSCSALGGRRRNRFDRSLRRLFSSLVLGPGRCGSPGLALRWLAACSGHGASVGTLPWTGFLQLPHHDRPISAGGGEDAAIRRESHGSHRALVPAKRRQFHALRGVPQPDRIVVSTRGQPLTIRRKRHAAQRILLLVDRQQQLAARHVPDADRLVPAAEASRRPSGENADCATPSMCPVRVRSNSPVSGLSNWIVWSSLDEANVLPSREQATLWTAALCNSTFFCSLPDCGSQKRIVLSTLPETS